MQYKLGKLFWTRLNSVALVLASLLQASPALATITLTQVNSGVDASNIYVAGDTFSAGAFVDTGAGYQAFDLTSTSSDQVVHFDLTSNSSSLSGQSNLTVVILAQDSSDTSEYHPIPIAQVDSVDCTSNTCKDETTRANTYFYGAVYLGQNATLRLGFLPRSICEELDSNAKSITGCATSSVDTVAAGTDQKMVFRIGIASLSSTDDIAGTEYAGFNFLDVTDEITVHYTESQHTLDCPGSSDSSFWSQVYFPGDGQILFNPTVISTSAVITAENTSSGVPETHVVVAGAESSLSGASITSGSDLAALAVQGRVAFSGGTADSVGGFTNSTTNSPLDHPYQLVLGIRNAAGIVGDMDSDSDCALLTDVATASIGGFLQEGNCFIATGAFGTNDGIPLDILREFRDQVLYRFSIGAKLVRAYYEWSPAAAAWLSENPHFRFPVLVLLVPIEIVAWLFVHPLFLSFLLALGALSLLWTYLLRREQVRST